MVTSYTDCPHNFAEIETFVFTDTNEFPRRILEKKKCFFYDTCSFRKHANLELNDAHPLFEYIKQQDGIVIITRTIIMELASYSGALNEEYISFFRGMKAYGLEVWVIYEEYLYSVLDICFSTNAAINDKLSWAVRYVKRPAGAIGEMIERDIAIIKAVERGNALRSQDIYKSFFTAVRENKESGDNLGEEVLSICLYILSCLPGEPDGKFCIITEDKGAASQIDNMFKKIPMHLRGSAIGVYSTPKLVQCLNREGILGDKETIISILSGGASGKIKVLGSRIWDVRANELSLDCEELAELIIQPNELNIIF